MRSGSRSVDSVPAVPSMPLTTKTNFKHRFKIPDVEQTFYNLCVARSVGKNEILSNPAAQASIEVEWQKLEKSRVAKVRKNKTLGFLTKFVSGTR